MSRYLRPSISGASVFFTVGLSRRGGTLLVDQVELLRSAVRDTMADHPFVIDAWVVLPDHLHAVWTLPEGDTNYSWRWGAIKARFSRSVRRAGFIPPIAPRLPCGGVNPALPCPFGVWISSCRDLTMDRRKRPIGRAINQSMLHWVFVAIPHMVGKICGVANVMLPKPLLPNPNLPLA